jgi:hypothetical protein
MYVVSLENCCFLLIPCYQHCVIRLHRCEVAQGGPFYQKGESSGVLPVLFFPCIFPCCREFSVEKDSKVIFVNNVACNASLAWFSVVGMLLAAPGIVYNVIIGSNISDNTAAIFMYIIMQIIYCVVGRSLLLLLFDSI